MAGNNLKDLRRRIRSVANTQQITKAMKLVAAAKFGKAQNAVVQARGYFQNLARLVESLSQQAVSSEQSYGALFTENSSAKKVLILALSSERGLCGGYNSNIAKLTLRTIQEMESVGLQPVVVCLGKKAFQSLSRRILRPGEAALVATDTELLAKSDTILEGVRLVHLADPFEKASLERAAALSRWAQRLYAEKKIQSFKIVYNRFQSAMTQIPTVVGVLPIQRNATSEVTTNFVIEPDLQSVLTALVPRFLSTSVFQATLEAIASEHGARMSAMDSATRNAREMSRKLQIQYQRARQAAITKELIEIISGAEAL